MKPLAPAVLSLLFLVAPLSASAQAVRQCGTPTHTVTVVGTAGASVPVTSLTQRVQIDVCNSNENTGSPVMKCRQDGAMPAMGTGAVGDVILKGECVRYYVHADMAVKCISDTAGTVATALECR